MENKNIPGSEGKPALVRKMQPLSAGDDDYLGKIMVVLVKRIVKDGEADVIGKPFPHNRSILAEFIISTHVDFVLLFLYFVKADSQYRV